MKIDEHQPKIGIPTRFGPILGTLRIVPHTAFWRPLIFGMRSSVQRMAQKAKVDLLSATGIPLPCHLPLASVVPINRSNDHFLATETERRKTLRKQPERR